MRANEGDIHAVRPNMHLLGRFRLAPEDGPAVGRKARAILAYLVLSPDRCATREQLAGLLWSDRGPDQARASLRQSLKELRELPSVGAALATGRDAVTLDPDALAVDVHEIRHAAAAHDLGALAGLLEQARGDLLEDFLDLSPAFDEWLLAERTRQHDLLLADALEALEADGLADMKNARDILRSLDRLDPVNEAVVRLGMRLDHSIGDAATLHRRYRQLCDRLASEFQALPSEETRALFHALATGRDGPSAAAVRDSSPARAPPAAAPSPPPAGNDLVPLVLVASPQTGANDPSLESLAAFCADDICVSLSRERGMQVVALDGCEAPEALQFGEHALGIYLLSGSLRRLGGEYRANFQLADATSRVILWSDTMSLGGSDDEVLDVIVGKAAGAVLPAIDRDLYQRLEQSSHELYDERAAYTRARLLIRSAGGLPAVQEGVRLLEGIVETNPRHLGARLLLFRMYHTAFWQQVAGHDTERFRELAEQHLQAAARVEPGHYVVGLGHAWRHVRGGRVADARREFEAVLAKLPHDADMTNACAMGFCYIGLLEQAERLMQRAFFLTPFPPSDFHADYALLLALKGEHDAAEEHFAVAGEVWLEYTAARIANAAWIERGSERIAPTRDRFMAEFRRAWQPPDDPTLADVLEWVGYVLPLNPPEKVEWLRQGVRQMLEPFWPAARDSGS